MAVLCFVRCANVAQRRAGHVVEWMLAVAGVACKMFGGWLVVFCQFSDTTKLGVWQKETVKKAGTTVPAFFLRKLKKS